MQSFIRHLPVLAAAVLAAAAAPADAAGAAVEIDHCLISVIDEADVPAQEPGVLKEILMKEGRPVAADDLLAQIDDAVPRMEVQVARAKLAVAQVKAGNDINIRYAKAAADAAKAGYDRDAAANRKVPNSVPAEVLTEKLMEYIKAKLSIEQADLEQRIARHEVDVAKAEVEAAKEKVRRHQIRSPQAGVVDNVHRHAGEWVQQGDPVVHVIRLDHLRVDCFVNAVEHRPGEFIDCDARVSVALSGGGKSRTFPGKVVFVDPKIQAGGVFLVRVEVQNEKENEFWLLSPGQGATMTIMTK